MPTDYEYLAQAGIDAETGGAANQAAAAPEPSESSNTSIEPGSAHPETKTEGQTQLSDAASGQEPTAADVQKAVEMFELMGHKFPTNAEFTIPHGGKLLKVPYSKLANVYRQAEHFQDKYKSFNDEKSKFDSERKEYERFKGFYDKYGTIQEWAEKNPDKWAVIEELYQQREKHLLSAQLKPQSGLDAAQVGAAHQPQTNFDPLVQKIQALEEKLAQYDTVYNKFTESEKQKLEAQDVEHVKQEIQGFQEEYKEIDLQERDPDGVALWAKIVQWGLENGYHEFKPAALVYLNERVKDAIASRARAEALKGLKTDRQAGVIKRSATPISGQGHGAINTNKNIKHMSYSELAEMAKSMIGSAQESST